MNIKSLIHSKNENALAFFNILGPIILNGINFFTVPIFTRMLGTENYGIVSIYTTWVQVLSIVMGIQTGGTIAVSKAYFDEKEQNAYFSSALFLSCITSAAITLLTVIFIQPISAFMKLDRVIVFLMLLQGFGSYVISFATLKFIYAKEASKNFLVSVLVSIFSVVISLILIVNISNFSDRYWGRIIGYALSNIVIGAALAVTILAKGKTFYHKAYWKFCLPLCLPLIFHHLSQIVLAQCDRIMLQQLLNDNGIVGIYSFIFTFVHILNIIWSALNNTWVPFYYDYVKQNNIELIHRRSKNYMFLYTTLCAGFVLLSPEVVKLFSSADFWSGMELIPIIAFSCYMVFLYSFPVNFEFYHKKTILIACGTCSAAVVNIVLNFLFIPLWGNIGAATATAISYIMLFLFHQIIAKYVIKQEYHYSWIMFLPGIVVMLLVSALFYVTVDLWYVRWPIGIVLGIILLRRIYRNKSIF